MTTNKIQPPFLQNGDEVAIFSPSFCIEENFLIDAVTFLESGVCKSVCLLRKLSGKLEALSALVVGGMHKIEQVKLQWGKDIEETILEIVDEYDYPIFFNFPAGHITDNRVLYIGRQVKIEVRGDIATMIFV
jgi:muramoyltetrapeptide carboxypeptidase LdcA involved in peptidoglycan recycling